MAVFLTRFTWFGRLSADSGAAAFAGYRGTPLGGFEIALVMRAVILVACIGAWIAQRQRRPVSEESVLMRSPRTAA